MPITKSAKKALRRDRRRQTINLRTKKRLREALKKANLKPTAININKVQSLADRAAKKRVIHKNKAARLKSTLAKIAPKTKKKVTSKAKGRKSSPKSKS
jgi:small subunit ribosomal protein S20